MASAKTNSAKDYFGRHGLSHRVRAAWLAGGLIWISSVIAALGAEPEEMPFAGDVSGFSTQKWGVDQGLPQVSVMAISQAQDGYLWLGTTAGLVKFDGLRFTSFDANSTDLHSLRIRSLWETEAGELWIGTEAGGLSKYWKGSFSNIGSAQGLKGSFIYQLLEFPAENLLVRTDQGLFTIHGNSAVPFPMPKEAAPGFISCAMKDGSDALLLGMPSGLFTLKNGILEQHPLSRKEELQPVTALLRDRTGKLWIGCRQGLLISDGDQTRRLLKIKQNPITVTTSIRQDSRGDVWVCTDAGLCRFKGGGASWETFEEGHDLAASHIQDVLEDVEGNHWVATRYKGLFRLQAERINVLMPPKPPAENRSVAWRSMVVVMEDSLGSLFFAGNCSGLTKYQNGVYTHYTRSTHGLENECVWALAGGEQRGLWIGTYGGGLYFLKDEKLARHIDPGFPADMAVLALLEDSEQALWIGTQSSGLKRLKDGAVTAYTVRDGLANDTVVQIKEARDHSLWLGTLGGLSHLAGGKFVSWTTKEGLPNNQVRAIYEDEAGVIWIGTYGGGLCRFKNGTFTPIQVKDGLHENFVHQIFEDAEGNLWMSGNQGITRAKKTALNDFAEKRASRVVALNYGVADGMLDRECNGGFQPSGWKTQDGAFLFPTQKGIARVRPSSLTHHPSPPILIEQITAGTQAISARPRIELPAGSRTFEIRYTALNLSAPEKTRFRYRLFPFEKNWQEVENRRVAYYTKVPPGIFEFQVAAENSGSGWSPVPAAATLFLPAYFHETKTCMALAGTLGVASIFGAIRWREHRTRANETKLKKGVETRTRDLQAAHEKAERQAAELRELAKDLGQARDQALIASQVKNQFLAGMSHELRTPLHAILGFAELLNKEPASEQERAFVSAITASGQHLLALVDDLFAFSNIEVGKVELHPRPVSLRIMLAQMRGLFLARATEKGLEVKADWPPDVPEYFLFDEIRLRQLLWNLVGNAVKFTTVGSVIIRGGATSMGGENDPFWDVFIEIQDTGIGISTQEQAALLNPAAAPLASGGHKTGHCGLGLTISRQLVDCMNGKLTLRSSPGAGSTFRVQFTNIRRSGPPESTARPC